MRIFKLLLIFILAFPTTAILRLISWKKQVILQNIAYFNNPLLSNKFSLRQFYFNISIDFWIFFTKINPFPIKLIDPMGAYTNLKNGGILLSAHYGNFELMGRTLKKNNIPIKGLHQTLNNSFWNNILKKLRKADSYVIQNKYSTRDLFRAIQNKNLLTLLNDQYSVLHYKNFPSPFLLKKYYPCSPLPDKLQKHHNPPFFICFLFRKNFNYQLDIRQIIISPLNFSTFNQQFISYLEKLIEQNPNHWYNLSHRIFKNITPNIYK